MGHRPSQDSAFGEGASPPKPTSGIGEEGARSPRVLTRKIPLSPTGLGLDNPTRLKFVKPLRLYSVAGSGKRARKVGDVVGAAFAELECAIERGDELKLPLDSCIEGPHFANVRLCLVAGGYAELVPHSTLGGVWEPKQCCRSPNLEESVPLRVERCSTDIRNFHSERNAVQRHSTLDETGAVF